jgi:hypothetical protein
MKASLSKAPLELLCPRRDASRCLNVAIVRGHIEVSHRCKVDSRAILFGDARSEDGQLAIQRLGA